MSDERKHYPGDVTDEEWNFCVPYLTLMKADAPQRKHTLRELFNGLRWLARTGSEWRMMPHDLPPWHAVYQQTRRWIKAGCFETMAEDLRVLLRVLAGRNDTPSAVIVDSRTIQSTPESGGPRIRDQTGSGEVEGSEEGLRAVAQALGGGTIVWLGGTIPQAGPGLRAVGQYAGRVSLAGVCAAHAQKLLRQKCMTGSSHQSEQCIDP